MRRNSCSSSKHVSQIKIFGCKNSAELTCSLHSFQVCVPSSSFFIPFNNQWQEMRKWGKLLVHISSYTRCIQTGGQPRSLDTTFNLTDIIFFPLGWVSSHMQDSGHCWWTWTSVTLQLNWKRSCGSNGTWRTRRGQTEIGIHEERGNLW